MGCIDAPHVLRDPRPDVDGKVLYFPQYALSKYEQPGDLHHAVMGREIGSGYINTKHFPFSWSISCQCHFESIVHMRVCLSVI
jgi:hypothetical protein